MQSISTNNAPKPAGHYEQAVVHGGHVYVSGQLPVPLDGPHDPGASFEVQASRALAHLLSILAAAGSSPQHVLKVSAYIVGVENWAAFNAIYRDVFGTAKPARSVISVPELHHGYLIEIDAVAVQGDK